MSSNTKFSNNLENKSKKNPPFPDSSPSKPPFSSVNTASSNFYNASSFKCYKYSCIYFFLLFEEFKEFERTNFTPFKQIFIAYCLIFFQGITIFSSLIKLERISISISQESKRSSFNERSRRRRDPSQKPTSTCFLSIF